MFDPKLSRHSLEVLESRIAPATIAGTPLLPTSPDAYVHATIGAPIELHAGQVLTTGAQNSGTYLLYLEKGDALIFITDLNNNKDVDFNEITGISAGDGMRLISFVDIHGDIVTNLKKTTTNFPESRVLLTLSDSDSNPSNDPADVGGDGRVLLNNTIEKVELRSLRITDLTDQNNDGEVDDLDVDARRAPTTASIFGNIFAGRGFGALDGGLILDNTGATNFGFATVSQIGSVKTGTAASGQFYSFGASRADDSSGIITTFTAPKGQSGGDIIGVMGANAGIKFNLDGVQAGNGGIGGRGGNVVNVSVNGDDTGGYYIMAGNGGRGPSGGAGGSILNFSDIGSSTSKVVIQSGSGGAGATGAGGGAGDLTFTTFNISGNVNLNLGDGGDGFTAGGNGASLATGVFTQPGGIDYHAGNGYGTTHLPSSAGGVYTPTIGTHQAIDFDNDGFGDFVFTTKNTSQLVVTFGDPNDLTGFRTVVGPDGIRVPDRFYLPGARNAEALAVADLNGDGHPDIATASMDTGSHAGVLVFFSKYEHTGSGPLTGNEDLNGNGINDFLGFEAPRFSVMPMLDTGDPDTANAILPFWESPVQISAITAGDFDGDGNPELAVVATYYGLKSETNGVITSLTGERQVLVFMTQDIEVDNITGQSHLTGQFYADFGTKLTDTPQGTIPADPRVPFFTIAAVDANHNYGQPRIVIEATALSDGSNGSTPSTHDVVVVGVKDTTELVANGFGIQSIDYSQRNSVGGLPRGPVSAGQWSMGRVDIDRLLPDGGDNHIDLQPFTLLDFTVADIDNDGVADLGAISFAPAGFLIGIKGDGIGGGTQDSGGGNNNSGNFFGDPGQDGPRAIAGAGYNIGTTTLLAIKSADVDADGQIDDLVVFHDRGDFALFQYQSGEQEEGNPPAAATGALLFGTIVTPRPIGITDPVLIDTFFPDANDLSLPGYMTASAPPDLRGNVLYARSALGSSILQLGEVGLKINAGDGGNSLIGKGGSGGSLGTGGKLVTTMDQITGISTTDYTGTLNLTIGGTIRLVAGDGGDGFSNGGMGGNISGVSVRLIGTGTTTAVLSASASLVGGIGGRGVSGTGGDGGTLSQNSIRTFLGQTNFIAGNGGVGVIGGAGGSVVGNGSIIFDSDSTDLFVLTGNGGIGTKRGGNGGSITNFSPIISGILDNGSITYTTGNGGNAVSGPGGAGGSIVNSSPRPNAFIDDPILLTAGDGGNGTTGGAGGSIVNFVAKMAAPSKNPSLVQVVAGSGGDGINGVGGRGGSVSTIDITSRGTAGLNKVIAGDGGSSAGGSAGAGGDVTSVRSSSNEGAFAIAAGAGGKGLIAGGKGGDVVSADISLGASTLSKGLIIAGAGGDATAFIPNRFDGSVNQVENQFGGRVGIGGTGGSINGFSQRGSTGAHVDLIAGNGGSTLNYGSVSDPVPFVGRGGSIQNVTVAGNIGNVTGDNPNTPQNEDVAIKSYNDILNGETIAQFVDARLRNGFGTITDADGNVGAVVGAAGRNKAVVIDPVNNPNVYTSQPASFAKNGDLITMTARNILSAVAGSVDRIASIHLTKGLRVLGGVLGADKGVKGQLDYLDENGAPTPPPGGPVRDGRLIDGALVTSVLQDSAGRPITLPGRVFFL